MAWTEESKAAMAAAATEAIAEFDAQVVENKNGTFKLPSGQWLVDWVAKWKNSAGYRRLCRHIIQYTTPAKES